MSNQNKFEDLILRNQLDVIDALMSVGAYLKLKGLKKIEMTIGNNARLRIEIDTDWVAELNDRFADAFRANER